MTVAMKKKKFFIKFNTTNVTTKQLSRLKIDTIVANLKPLKL
jgi:hypothetical protein